MFFLHLAVFHGRVGDVLVSLCWALCWILVLLEEGGVVLYDSDEVKSGFWRAFGGRVLPIWIYLSFVRFWAWSDLS